MKIKLKGAQGKKRKEGNLRFFSREHVDYKSLIIDDKCNTCGLHLVESMLIVVTLN